MKIRKNWPIAFLLIIFIAILLIAVYFSIKFGCVLVGSIDAWIGFSGSILGGGITMFALLLTFKHEKAVAESNNALSIRPCIIGEFTCYDHESKELIIADCINNYGFINWKMTNITENLANKVTICDEYSLVLSEYPDNYIRKDDLYEEFGISIYTTLIEDYVVIKPRGEQDYKTNLSIDMNNLAQYSFEGSAFMFKHAIVFQYRDITDKQTYKTKFEFGININVDVDNHLHFFLWSVGNTMLDT
ncbi:MAG: hypothetical protein RR787_08020 [Hydrogenoanaerobacterium sp.]